MSTTIMLSVEKERSAEPNARYATRPDFCRSFQEDMRPLYLLAFLLTANHARAEQCYAESMENVTKGKPVFKEGARSWIKETVIQSAIRMVLREPTQPQDRDAWNESPVSRVTDAVTRLAPLMRFVFVMSVLERYSDRECSRLLNCTVRDVITARSQALRTTSALSGVTITRTSCVSLPSKVSEEENRCLEALTIR
jgi:DNA-directed RNA polymerase specialized sigma24 family protein